MAVDDAHVFPGIRTPVQTRLSFQSSRLLSLHASAEVRGENTPERKFTSTAHRLTTTSHESDTLTNEPPGALLNFLRAQFMKRAP